MAARRRRNISEQDSDYDGAWKEVLRQHLREILEKYLPVIAAEIDWRHSPQWSDKELGRILRQRRRRPKSVDMLVKVRLLNGAEQWILLHLEIQSGREAGFEFRIFRYNLYDFGYNAGEVREIFRLIDWMMSLPEDLSRKFEEDLVALEESLNMPYVTSVERIAEARGKHGGRQRVAQQFFSGNLHGSVERCPWTSNSGCTDCRSKGRRNSEKPCWISGRWMICAHGWMHMSFPRPIDSAAHGAG